MAAQLKIRVAYWDTPDQVLWIDLGHRRLQGADTYWVAGNRYGIALDVENRHTMYADSEVHEAAWEYLGHSEQLGHQEVQLADPTPPADATVWRGFMLTDEQARWVGLI